MQCAHEEEIIGVRSTTATIYKGFPGLRIVGITRVVSMYKMYANKATFGPFIFRKYFSSGGPF